MNRRDFVRNAALATMATHPVFSHLPFAPGRAQPLATLGAGTLEDFAVLLKWMQANGWLAVIKKATNLDLDVSDPQNPDLFKQLTIDKTKVQGLDDFIGNKLIEAGSPARSLLYHLLASPRIRDTDVVYPSLEQIDLVENYLYGRLPLDPEWTNPDQTVLAVFSYEYRPACKTPHGEHADMVFARTGFSRIGTQPMSVYDTANRCFTNKPIDAGKEKEIAVTPARYGLFLARSVTAAGLSLNTHIRHDSNNNIQFLLPVRKIFTGDPILQGATVAFSESHLNEKLARLWPLQGLVHPQGIHFDATRPPFVRRSSSSTIGGSVASAVPYDTTMVELTPMGSSVLLSSIPAPLVRRAAQQVSGTTQRLRVFFPEAKTGGPPLNYSNRRYTSYKTLNYNQQARDAFDAVRDKAIYPKRILTDYEVPRNAPMFVNMREKVSAQDGNTITYLGPETANLQTEINKGYWAGLFEDSICDGCITAAIIPSSSTTAANPFAHTPLLPAFSIVTAPDFFPLIESYDLNPFEDTFLVGGTEDMSGGRKAANPDILMPGSTATAFPVQAANPTERLVKNTVTAIVSNTPLVTGNYTREKEIAQADQQTRSNYMPDCATKIFYPGWDVTYSNHVETNNLSGEIFYATYGLGSPFAEDTKLCAAVNGMWVAASPDASRTYRGSLTTVPTGIRTSVLPPTAIPLVDMELGFHPQSPAVRDHGLIASTGWDGEQGPYLYREGQNVFVNFTDIGRADYVHNALNGLFDMSLMRQLTTAVVKLRMDCLQRCYQTLGIKAPYTEYWLVGCEEVKDWTAGAAGTAVPKNLSGGSTAWATTRQLSAPSTEGYLFILADLSAPATSIPGSRRMNQKCDTLYVFQVDKENATYCILNQSNGWTPNWI